MAIYNNRICKSCGIQFSGGPRAWYCPNCREERKRTASRESKKREARGLTRKIGSTDICENCGKSYIVNSGLQKYCDDCREKMHKKIDNEQGTAYYHERVDKNRRKITRKIQYDKNNETINESRREKYAEKNMDLRQKCAEIQQTLSIKTLREKAKMTVKEFSDYFLIPIATIKNWEKGRHNPPAYILMLVKYMLKKEGKI